MGIIFRSRVKKRNWQIDYDYIEKLTPEMQKYLEKFTAEFYGGSFGKDPLHRTEELQRDCFNRNNRTNRDLYNHLQCTGRLAPLEDN